LWQNCGKNTKNLAIIFTIDDFFPKLLALLQKNAYLCTRTPALYLSGGAGATFVGKQ
jgi:hypothetical protein